VVGEQAYTRRLENATPNNVTLTSEGVEGDECTYYAELCDDVFFAIYALSFGLDICTQSIREL
jgi:hypothetical protein